MNADFRRQLETEHGGKRDDFLFEVQQHLERDVEEVAAAAGGVHDHYLAQLGEKGFDVGAVRRRTLAPFEGRQGGFDRGPFAAERGHEHGFNQGDDVGPPGVLRSQRGQLVGVQTTGKEGAHDARLDELPIRLGSFGEGAALFLVQVKDGGILEEMAVEVANLVWPKQAARGHRAKQRFEHL